MSLIVYPYSREPESDKIVQVPFPAERQLFGPEVWRKTIFSTSALKGMGCRVLADLENSDVYAEGADLAQLQEEMQRITDRLNINASENRSVLNRLENLKMAIEVALEIKGGVYIG